MKGKKLSNYVGVTNEIWAGALLELARQRHKAIDLVGETIGVEVKSKYKHGESNKWTIHEREYSTYPVSNPGRNLFWMFVTYDLDVSLDELQGKLAETMERHVTEREAWFLPWHFAAGLVVHKTEKDVYRYASVDEVCAGTAFEPVQAGKAILYVPAHSSIEEHVAKLGLAETQPESASSKRHCRF